MVFTWYCLNRKNYIDPSIAYTSVTLTIILLLLIILYHVYTYTNLFSKVMKTKLGRKMDRLFEPDTGLEPKPRHKCYTPPPDDNSHRPGFDDRDLLDELDCPVYTIVTMIQCPSSDHLQWSPHSQ